MRRRVVDALKPYRKKPVVWRVIAFAGMGVGAIVLGCALALLFFPDPIVNRFIKPRLLSSLAEAFPAYSVRIAAMKYSIFENRFRFDSVAVDAIDSTFSGRADAVVVSGVDWMHLLWGGTVKSADFGHTEVTANGIDLRMPRTSYGLACARLHLSVPDSTVAADALELRPLGGDAQFFRESRFRRTRLELGILRCSVTGVACLDLLLGKTYRARSVHVRSASVDLLVNRDKPFSMGDVHPIMPNELLASVQGILRIDSVRIADTRMTYGERYDAGAAPASITFDDLSASVDGIILRGNRSAAIVMHGRGILMHAGAMRARMVIPVPPEDFSFQYSGSLGRMDLSAFNPFLERSEQLRIKTGILERATFDIAVVSGRATGNVRAAYSNLAIVLINKQTGSENGVFDRIASFLSRTFKIRGTNLAAASGSMKVGEAKYTRVRTESFTEFAWYALRSGVGDVVGF